MDKSIVELMREFVTFKQNENTVNEKSICNTFQKLMGLKNG
ncbi:hypothetical protein L950_0210715 [Sphingobacterium sp. IITKGP-BTPF85]|nr:hypothetical protein L950_0210715 [Sphingobacterium sp. IITKGP-BTPF85]